MNSNLSLDTRTPDDGSSPLVLSELLDRCMGSASVAAIVLDKFEKQLQTDLLQIQNHVSASDCEQLARTAHALKGAAGAAAAKRLHQLAAQIEAWAREDQLSRIAKEVGSLQTEINHCLAYVPAARRGLASPPGS